MDYLELDVKLTFQACETRKCVNASIVDDLVDEPNEFFTYHLRRTVDLDPRIELDPMNGRIDILDNGGKYHIKCRKLDFIHSMLCSKPTQ